MAALERTRRRLGFAVRDLELAISFYEAARIPHLRADVQSRFSATEAGHTFVALRSAALFQATLTVMRLWDAHRDTASLVAIATDLHAPALLDDISADAARSMGALWGPTIAHEKRMELVALRELIFRTKDYRLHNRLGRLRAYRDKRLAHRDPFESERTANARRAEVKDMTVVLAASCYLLRRLRVAVDFRYSSPRDYRMMRRRYSEAFWAIPLRAARRDAD